MPFGDVIPTRAFGPSAAPLRADRAKERRRAAQPPDARQRADDEAEISAPQAIENSEGLRNPKGNADEEAHDDRTEHGHYTAQGRREDESVPHRLDISG